MPTRVFAALFLFATACATTPKPAAPKPELPLKSDHEKTLYAIGMTVGQSLGVFQLQPGELEYIQQGIADAVAQKEPAVDMEFYGQQIQELARSRAGKIDDASKAKAQEYLTKAAAEEGMKALPSGVLYKELQAGSGASPEASDTVRVHYRGELVDGTEFDSSYARNEPVEFPLDQVIPCWTEGVQQMKVGGKAKLVCPPEQAYGARGAPPKIPGGAVLVFTVELIGIAQ